MTPSPHPRNSKVANMIRGNLLILIATIFFGVDLPVVKMLIPTWMDANDVTAFRMLGGCALMWLTSLFMHNDRIARSDWRKIAIGGAVGLFSFIYLFNLALHYSNPIDVGIIMTLPPAFVVAFGLLFRHMRVSRLEIAGLIVSFVGALIVIVVQHSGSKGSDEILGDLTAIASSACYALYLIVLEGPTRTYRPVSLLRWVYLAACIPSLLLIPGLCHAEIWHTTAIEPWGLIVFVVLCPTFLAYFLMTPAIKLISPELVSLYQYLIPVVASIASVIMGVDHVKWIQVVAMVVIVGGMAMSNIGKFRRTRQTEAAN